VRVALQVLGFLGLAVIALAAVVGAVLFQLSFAIYVALALTAACMIGIVTLCFGRVGEKP
jgi:hypothetical protein